MNRLDNIRQSIEFVTNEIYTTEVAKVVTFYPKNSTADVTFLIKRVTNSGAVEESPMFLGGVPIRYPQMGDFVLYAPLKKDDAVFLHFSRTDWDNWLLGKSNTAVVKQDGMTRHSYNCPYIEVGARNKANPARQDHLKDQMHMSQGSDKNTLRYLTMTSEGLELASGSTTIVIGSNGEVTVTSDKVTLDTPLVHCTANLQVDGDIINTFSTGHTHGYTDDGNPSQTTPPVSP